MAITREDLIPSLIENTSMKKVFRDGIHVQYDITPNEGYVLHDSTYDTPILVEGTGEETGEVVLGYRVSTASVAARYDFEANPRELYAVLASDVPADQIFGTTEPTPEVM